MLRYGTDIPPFREVLFKIKLKEKSLSFFLDIPVEIERWCDFFFFSLKMRKKSALLVYVLSVVHKI